MMEKEDEDYNLIITGVVSGWDGGGHENGEAFALTLKGGHPPLSSESHTGAQQWLVELVNLALIVLCMLHPRHLHLHYYPY